MPFSEDVTSTPNYVYTGWRQDTDAPTLIIIAQLDRVIELLEELNKGPFDVTIRPKIDVQAMQVRADSNRDNAATLYGDVLYCGCAFARRIDSACNWHVCFYPEDHPKAWRRKDTGARVVFTPYGWVDEPE